MLYESMYALSGLLSDFFQQNPAMESYLYMPEEWCRETVDEVTETALSQRLEEWLERPTTITDPTHRATLLQLAASYEASATPHDTWTSSIHFPSESSRCFEGAAP
jgi:hypothetical protein